MVYEKMHMYAKNLPTPEQELAVVSFDQNDDLGIMLTFRDTYHIKSNMYTIDSDHKESLIKLLDSLEKNKDIGGIILTNSVKNFDKEFVNLIPVNKDIEYASWFSLLRPLGAPVQPLEDYPPIIREVIQAYDEPIKGKKVALLGDPFYGMLLGKIYRDLGATTTMLITNNNHQAASDVCLNSDLIIVGGTDFKFDLNFFETKGKNKKRFWIELQENTLQYKGQPITNSINLKKNSFIKNFEFEEGLLPALATNFKYKMLSKAEK